MTPETKIKSRGHWRINFRPSAPLAADLPLAACRDLVEKNAVDLRGWDYPHLPRRNDSESGLQPGNSFWQGWVNWSGHIELWRMYQSRQFIHLFAMREDWMEEDDWFSGSKLSKPGEHLSVLDVSYRMAEIFEFLSRLTTARTYDFGVDVRIELFGTEGRALKLYSPDRVPLSGLYKTAANHLSFERRLAKAEVLDQVREIAADAALYFFERFGFTPTRDLVTSDQARLLSGRI